MRTINSVASEELRWIKPTSELPYELLSADDEVVGQLQLDHAWRGDVTLPASVGLSGAVASGANT